VLIHRKHLGRSFKVDPGTKVFRTRCTLEHDALERQRINVPKRPREVDDGGGVERIPASRVVDLNRSDPAREIIADGDHVDLNASVTVDLVSSQSRQLTTRSSRRHDARDANEDDIDDGEATVVDSRGEIRAGAGAGDAMRGDASSCF
jgi:hypothetical protein